MTDAEVEARVAELLERYPYDPQINPAVYGTGSPEQLRGVPDGMRESLARIYVRSKPRWARDAEYALRQRQGKPVVIEDPATERYR